MDGGSASGLTQVDSKQIDSRRGVEDNVLVSCEVREGIARKIEVYRALKIRRLSDGTGFFGDQ